MSKMPLHDRASFWVALSLAPLAIGGVFVGVGVPLALSAHPPSDVLRNPWFLGGLVGIAVGVLMAWWSLTLHLAHRHAEVYQAESPRGGPRTTRAPKDPPTAIHPTDAAMAARAKRDAEVTDHLNGLIAEHLGDIPLREGERQIVFHILRAARQSLGDSPFLSMQPGNAATDIQFNGRRRDCTDPETGQQTETGEQMWYIQTNVRGTGVDGVLRSDETLGTLVKLHGAIQALREHVYDHYHPPI